MAGEERKYRSYNRESVKAWFTKDFHNMLEREGLPTNYGYLLEKSELQKMIGKNVDIDVLLEERRLIALWPGENKPVFPYFQLNKGRLRPEIAQVLSAIDNGSDETFYSPMMLCKWFFTPVGKDKRITPLMLMKKGKTKKLIQEAQKFGQQLLPRKPTG